MCFPSHDVCLSSFVSFRKHNLCYPPKHITSHHDDRHFAWPEKNEHGTSTATAVASRGIPWHTVAYCGTRRIFQGTVGTEASCSWRRWASEAPCPVLLPWGLTRELSIKASMYSNHQKDPKKNTAMSVGFDMFFFGDCYTDEWLLHMIGLDYRKDRGALMKPKLEVFWSEHDQNITKSNGSSWFIIMFIHI